jgi:formate hydrogenlyase transcriptional activator
MSSSNRLESDAASRAKADEAAASRAESLISAETRALEMIAGGARLADVLDTLCDTIDAQSPGMISTVLLMDADGRQLWPTAGRRLPADWREAITPLPVAPDTGLCGTAAFLKQRVIVSDISTDPLFSNRRGIALRNGLRAGWSQPLISKDQEVLGTFAMYYSEPRSPSTSDLRLIEGAAHVALIAIQADRSRTALHQAYREIKQSETRLRQLIDFLPQHVLVLDASGRLLQANQTMLDFVGHTLEEMQEVRTDERIRRDLHPDDFERAQSERQRGLSAGVPFEMEKRLRGKDGWYRWFLFRYNPILNEEGTIAQWFATATDIEGLKQAEERVLNENLALREDIDRSSMFEEIIGSSEPLRRVLAQVTKVARTDSTVLISGETGTGKELIARAIHKRSGRAAGAFIAVNCSAIPSSLIASELFGHEKGAFTGALQRRVGRFEAADRGTIFLDEVGELPAETQIALLRVLQEREFERVGSNQPIIVDVRVLAAANRDLKAAVAAGAFREDLYYRLNVFPIHMPSLRERADDIPLLVEYLIGHYAKKTGRKIRTVKKGTLELLAAYDWPGNVRELQNVVERAVILSDGATFSVDEAWLAPEGGSSAGSAAGLGGTIARRERELERHEREAIEAALASSGGRIAGPSGAAAKLGIPRQTLDSKIRSLRINKHRFKSA